MAKKKVDNIFEIDGMSYKVLVPDAKINRSAQLEYNRVYGTALRSNAPLRAELHKVLEDSGVWNEEKKKELKDLAQIINDGEVLLEKGGCSFEDALKTAKKMRKTRRDMQVLYAQKAISDGNCVEGQAENAKFQRQLSLCLVYNTDVDGHKEEEPVYPNVDDLLDDFENPRVQKAYEILSALLYETDSRYEHNLPENKFLKEWGYLDEELRLLNEKGEFVDEEGKRVDEKGRYVNDEGQLIDSDGNVIDEEGKLVIVEKKPFLDKDGNPLTPPSRG